MAVGFFVQVGGRGECDAAQQAAGADQADESASEVCIAYGAFRSVLGLIAQLLGSSAQNR